MKKLFVAVLAIAGLVACNNEETVLVQGPAPIAFDGSFVETRADVAVDPSTTTANIETFNVWGFMDEPSGKVFVEEKVTKNGGEWSYANIQYWAPGHNYYFAALSNYDNAVVDTTDANDLGLGNIEFTVTDGSDDLLYSAVGPIAAPAQGATSVDPVKFSFNHMLSKVKFTFTNGFTNELATIDVKNIQMTVPATADIDVNVADWWSTNCWKNYNGTETVAFGDACAMTAMGVSQEAADERIILPADATQKYTVTFDVVLYQGTVVAYEGTKTVTIENVALEMGKAYNFKATLSADNITADGTELLPIVFDVEEVKDWVTAGTPDVNVQEAELRAAILLGGEVTLTENLVITEPLVVAAGAYSVINLNGKKIINENKTLEYGKGEGIVVYGDLVINGEGLVKGSTRAVWARGDKGATVTINGGTYEGCEEGYAEGGNSVIYASSGNVVNIYGGTVKALAADKTSYANKTEGVYAALNVADNNGMINVYGGSFYKQNPAAPGTEPAAWNAAYANGFVAEGYYSSKVGDYYVVSDATLVVTAEDLQKKLDEAVDGDVIRLAADIEGNVVVSQKAGVKVTIDGAGYNYAGVIVVDGKSGTYTTAGLTIKNVKFVADSINADAIIRLGNGTDATRYTCNVSVIGCTFDVLGAVAVKSYTGGDKNLVISNCTASANCHSMLQAAGIDGILVEKSTVLSKNGLNFNNSADVAIEECVVDTKGYCARFGVKQDGTIATEYNISNSTLKSACEDGDAVIILRKNVSGSTLNVLNTTLEGTVQFTNEAGAKVYVDGVLM